MAINNLDDLIKLLFRITYYSTLLCIPAGVVLSNFRWWWFLPLFVGFAGMVIFFTVTLVRDIMLRRSTKFSVIPNLLLILMSVILFGKYIHVPFTDYPGLIIMPVFIVYSLFYLFAFKERNRRVSISIAVYLLVAIPVFGVDILDPPRQYFPTDWYRELPSKGVSMEPRGNFLYQETAILNDQALEYYEYGNYYEASKKLHAALKLEPQNPWLLFDLSNVYAKLNDISAAIAWLDTAISIDSTQPEFYNNRGLYLYHLDMYDRAIQDYLTAIGLDSTESLYYGNLALAYHMKDMYKEMCEILKVVERLEDGRLKERELRVIQRYHCR